MARKSTRKRQASEQPPGGLSRKAGVWLATLSTVVGVATGMFALRDEVFPGEAGTAQALPDSVYGYKVGQICDELNAGERARARELRPLSRRLRHATTAQQRNALLDAVRHETARTSHALAALSALDPPKARAAGHRSTEVTWDRNLERVRTYAEQLDGASDRRQVLAAIRNLSRHRSAIARDSVRITAGLQRLGQEHCRIAPPIATPILTLPPPMGQVPGAGKVPGTPPGRSSGGGSKVAGAANAPGGRAGGGSGGEHTGGPGINTPSPSPAPDSSPPDSTGERPTVPPGSTGGGTTEGTGGGGSTASPGGAE